MKSSTVETREVSELDFKAGAISNPFYFITGFDCVLHFNIIVAALPTELLVI
jgi:hypothetical protein